MNKEDYKNALEEIRVNYDAYYFENKYGFNTHKKQFEILESLPQVDKVPNAIAWIKDCYDCWDKDSVGVKEDGPFAYLEKVIDNLGNGQ